MISRNLKFICNIFMEDLSMNSRKVKKFLLVFAMLFTFSVLCSGCMQNDEQAAKAVTQKYFNAVKSGDVDGAIKCFTPAFQEQYAALVAIGGQMSEYFFDMDGSDLLGGLMSYANQNAYKDCKFTADEVSFTNDSHDRATVHVTISGAGGDIPSETSVIVVKYDGKWYIEQ